MSQVNTFTEVVELDKKEFTSFDVAAVVRELQTVVLSSRVNNIFQLDSKTLIIKLHKADHPAFRLVLEAGRRLNLTAYASEKPTIPPAFCMALRKYLRNSWLRQVEQHEFERVVILTFDAENRALRLVLEVFGEGNIILIDQNGKILQALLYKKMRDRNVVRGEDFRFAPPTGKNPFKINQKELEEGLKALGRVEAARGVPRLLGIGGQYSEETLAKANVDKAEHCDALNADEASAIYESLQSLLQTVKTGKLEPCIIIDTGGDFVNVLPFRIQHYQGTNFSLQCYASFNGALDEFYARVSTLEKASAGRNTDDLKREAERIERIVTEQEETLVEAAAEAERDKHAGDAIYANIVDLHTLLERFLDGKQRGKEWKEIVSQVSADKRAGLKPWVLFESFDSKGLNMFVCVDGSCFGVNLRKTLFEEAARFYEQGKRAKQRMEGAKSALADSRKKLAELRSEIERVETLSESRSAEALEQLTQRKVKHKEWFEKLRWFVSSDGFLVVGAKDAVTNEVLIKKHTEKNDIVFHADIVGAPFVVIKTEGKEPSEQCLREAAEFAAAFSRGWREGFASIDVYWVKPEQLSKGGPSGESVGHGAFVVRGERNWMRGVPLRIAIGVSVDEDAGVARIGGGPLESVKAKTERFTVVTPGNSSGKELFRQVLRNLAGKTSKEIRNVILKLPSETVREFIPYSKGMILESKSETKS
jgi:predicted ribosome quality control (RQC) complex YloA/Tae2 family protein